MLDDQDWRSSRMNPFTPTLEAIWLKPSCVWVNSPAVVSVGARIASDEFPIPDWRESVFPEEDLVFLDFIGVGNAINFAFTDFQTHESFAVEHKGRRWRGAFGMWACLDRALNRGTDVLDGRWLRQASTKELEDIFASESRIPMLQERCCILREVGNVLCEKYNGHFRDVFIKGHARAFGNDGIVTRLIVDFPSFCDESLHRPTGRVLKFQKRAQLMAMMYHGRAVGSDSLRALSDARDVGPIADYGVPRALHNVGILVYSPDLEDRVQSRRAIESGSVEEQEIRAQTVRAQIELLEAINSLRSSKIDFIRLDYRLWMMGRSVNAPHHLTSTTAY